VFFFFWFASDLFAWDMRASDVQVACMALALGMIGAELEK